MPAVSVIMPLCNAEHLIKTSLPSALKQTYRDFEIIAIDDASTDRTVQVVQRYARRSKGDKIKLTHLANRVGTCAARNIGCEMAAGDYLAFLDQDDEWVPEKLQLQVDYLSRHPEFAMVLGDLDAIDPSGYGLDFSVSQDSRHPPSWEDILLLYPIYPSSCLLRKEVFWEVGGFNKSFVLSGAYGDQELNLRIRERSPIGFMDETVGYYCWNIERPSRAESFLVNLPIYARICWDRKQDTPLSSLDLQTKFINVCHGQYLYYANLLLGQFYDRLTDHQLSLIAKPRSELFEIFDGLYSRLTGMKQAALPESLDNCMLRLLVAIFLLRPDLQKLYPEALDGNYKRLLEWANNASNLRISDKYQKMLLHFRRDWLAECRPKGSPSRSDFEAWLHTPNWDLVRNLTGVVDILENPEDHNAVSLSGLPIFPKSSMSPRVSIIIPTYNKTGYLLNCLKSIALNTKSFNGRYEVIVVDNGSTDPTFEVISRIEGIQVVRLDDNKGFVEACNTGANVAQGKYLVFLNNDVIVTPDWLDALMLTIETGPELGAVGAKLVYPSGQLQEAGCIVWSNGMCHNYGRGDNPSRPEYNYRREVDYCSASCLLVRHDLFKRIGGFDRRYSPGYYEDVDLCFSIRKEGKNVIYQPRSVVIHFEGVTAGRDTRFGVKRHQLINREKFVAKWANELKTQRSPEDLLRGRERGALHSVLIVERRVPEPDKNSGDNRLQHVLRMLQSHKWQITLFADDNMAREPYGTSFRDSGIEAIHDQTLGQVLKGRESLYDVIWLVRPDIGYKYIDLIRKTCPNSKVVFDMPDLASLRERRWAELTGDKLLLKRSEDTKRKELYTAERSDLVIAISEREKALMLREDSTLRIEVLPNIHVVRPVEKTFEDRRDLLFLGGFEHAPNVDSLLYFVDAIFSRIRHKLPKVNLIVVGSDMPEKIRNLRRDGVNVVGYVKDPKPYFDSCRVFVAPIRFGAGVKGKIGLSMAFGLPVVTSSIGAEGMGLEHNRDVLISDDPSQFADHVIALYTDKQLWYRLSKNGQKNVRLRYDPKKVERMLSRILRKLSDITYEGFAEDVGLIQKEQLDTVHEELVRTRQELANVIAELTAIRGSLIYRALRSLASHIDSAFPEGTWRGEFRKTLTASVRIILDEGWKSFWRQAAEKIRKGEFYIRSA